MNIYAQRSKNVWKTWGLIFVFTVVVFFIGYFIAWYYGNPSILAIAIIVAIAMNFYAYWKSDTLVLSLNHARPATREEFFDFYTVTENLAITAGLPTPKLYVIDDPSPNAFATGRNEHHAVVCATTGLLQMMNRTELEGVIAHELSHVKNRDILLMTVAVVLAGFVALIANIFLRVSFFSGGRRGGNGEGNAGAVLLILGIVGVILAPLAAKLIELAISRKREYLADASGVLLTRYPEGLASALQKLQNATQPMRKPNLATAHLFISDPFGAKGKSKASGSWIEHLFSTHPPLAKRIQALIGNRAPATSDTSSVS